MPSSLLNPLIPVTHNPALLKRQIIETRLLLAVWLETYSLQSFIKRNVPALLNTNLPSFPTHLVCSHFYYCKISTWKMLSQVPEVREGDFYKSNESSFLSLPCRCFWVFYRQRLNFFHPPTPAPVSVPITLPVLDFGRLRATIRASVYGASHMAHNAKQQLHGNLKTSPPQGHGHAHGHVCPPR